MNAPMAFSDVCYQWGANIPALSRTVPLGQVGWGWGRLSEDSKAMARVIYMIGVSTFIAPVGLTYHLLQSGYQGVHSQMTTDPVQANNLSQLAWSHLRCGEKDFFSFYRGCIISAVVLTCLGVVTVSGLFKGVKENNLMITVIGGAVGFFAYQLIFDQSHGNGSGLIYPAWDDLAHVSHSLNHNHFDRVDLVSSLVSVLAVAIIRSL